MGDTLQVVTGNTLVYTGKGQVTGLVLTQSGSAADVATFYNNTTNSGTKIFEAYVPPGFPIIIFFHDSYALRFVIGLYAVLPAGITLTLWTRQL